MQLPRWIQSLGSTKRWKLKATVVALVGFLLGLGAAIGAPMIKWTPETVPAMVSQVATMTAPPTSELLTKLTNAKLSLAPICTNGTKVGYQAVSSTMPVTSDVTLGMAAEKFAPDWKTKLTPAPSPQIHARAKLAKVPIMMYHDILPEKQVFFDVTPAEFEAALQTIQKNGMTPIALDQLVEHLRTGIPLPKKPIVLTFDDGYLGHYKYVYPLMKKYNVPAAFAIYPAKVGTTKGRSAVTWEQLSEMIADPLVTIASHSVTHPLNLGELSDAKIQTEVFDSKRILEEKLGRPIKYFVYPSGKFDDRVLKAVDQAGYQAAWTMRDEDNRFAQDSIDLFRIERIGQSQLDKVMDQADGGPPVSLMGSNLNFYAPVELTRTKVEGVPLIFASGGKPVTIHADSRYQVGEIIEKTKAVAAVDGGFFSLEALNSNKMIGPVLSQKTGKFVAAPPGSLSKIEGRPLVLINDSTIKFIPFVAAQHNSQAGVEAELPGVTDAFVAAAWLVKDGQPRSTETFGKLFGFDAERDRAYWGIDWSDRPVVGVSGDYVNSVKLGQALSQAGLRDAVMLDSGASASLVYQGKSMMSYTPRPVPHVVALMPPVETAGCDVAKQAQMN